MKIFTFTFFNFNSSFLKYFPIVAVYKSFKNIWKTTVVWKINTMNKKSYFNWKNLILFHLKCFMIINCSIAHSYSLVFTLVHFHFHSPLVFTSVHSCSLAFYSCSLVFFCVHLCLIHVHLLVLTWVHSCSHLFTCVLFVFSRLLLVFTRVYLCSTVFLLVYYLSLDLTRKLTIV